MLTMHRVKKKPLVFDSQRLRSPMTTGQPTPVSR